MILIMIMTNMISDNDNNDDTDRAAGLRSQA